jgi:hypothetical protein
VAWLFKCSKAKSIVLLIAANYASAWVGGLLVESHFGLIRDVTIENIRLWLATFIAVAFAATLLIEFPFFWLTLRPRAHALRAALIATPAIHGISYGLLLGWYSMASATSMMTQLAVLRAGACRMAHCLWTFGQGCGHVVELRPRGVACQRIRLGIPHRFLGG